MKLLRLHLDKKQDQCRTYFSVHLYLHLYHFTSYYFCERVQLIIYMKKCILKSHTPE